jgi:nitroreductase
MLDLHPLLAGRWSPRAFDPEAVVTDGELTSLLEAARWAPSDRNSQPWRFVVARRGSDAHKQIFTNLTPGNRRWAVAAPVLLLGAHVASSASGVPLRHAEYDLGQAMAHLSVQATALGLHVHQMGGFAGDSVVVDLELPEGVVPTVVAAVGRLGDPEVLPADLRFREVGLRTRHPLDEIVLT